MTDAHDQLVTTHIRIHYPPHDTRQGDPHYAAFTAFEKRCKKLGLNKCAIASDQHAGPIQCHHADIEFSLQNDVDLTKFNELYGLHLESDDDFRAFVEGPGNAEWLCVYHHIGAEGVHVVPEPIWRAIRVTKDGVTLAEAEKADGTPLHAEALPDVEGTPA